MADKKVALITGANKGIGKEIARQLGAQGMTVLVGARDKARGEEAARELTAGGADVSCCFAGRDRPGKCRRGCKRGWTGIRTAGRIGQQRRH